MTADDTTPQTSAFDLSGPCAECETPSADCDPHGIGAVCCAGCAATSGCTHQPAFDAADTVAAPSKPDQSETGADVVEAAAKIIANHSEHGACMGDECSEDLLPVPYPRNRDVRNAFWDRHIARALQAAHLLADPADRAELDDLREEVAWRREASKEYGGIAAKYEADLRTLRVDLATAERMSGDIEDRAERAEAEVARLKAELAETRAEVDGYTVAQVAELREKVEQLRLIANVNGDWNAKFMQVQAERDELQRLLETALAERDMKVSVDGGEQS